MDQVAGQIISLEQAPIIARNAVSVEDRASVRNVMAQVV